MQYALLAYSRQRSTGIDPAIASILERPPVTGWIRLYPDESATTLGHGDDRLLITDGPFIDSKEYLAGIIVVEANNLDGALAVAREFQQARSGGAIEVRPVLESTFGGA
jgi:hypothetical protein